MAHYLAELLDRAENGSTEKERAEAKIEARDTIIGLWDHRETLPGNAYPLKSYKKALEVLNSFLPENDPFLRFHREKKYSNISELIIEISRLISIMLFSKGEDMKIWEKHDLASASTSNLDEDEKFILSQITKWLSIYKKMIEEPNIQVELETDSEHENEQENEIEGNDLQSLFIYTNERILKIMNGLKEEVIHK